MNLVESIMTQNPCYRTGRTIAVKGLMLHSVGCAQPSAKAFINLWNKPSYESACVHGFIDANDGTVYQTLPWNYEGWHAGGAANKTHIGVEMCEPACINYVSGATFTCSDLTTAQACTLRTYNAAVDLFAMLCRKYSLNPTADGVIISHREGGKRGVASNHVDPEHLWSGLRMSLTMDGFRKDVKARMQSNYPDKPNPENKATKDLNDYKVLTRSHVQHFGWLGVVGDGETSGTTGQSLRLEATEIKIPGHTVTYKMHIQKEGDTKLCKDGETCGTTGKGLRGEAIWIDCKDLKLEYRVHVQGSGWTPWVTNGTWAGTRGKSLRMEAIQVRVVGAKKIDKKASK